MKAVEFLDENMALRMQVKKSTDKTVQNKKPSKPAKKPDPNRDKKKKGGLFSRFKREGLSKASELLSLIGEGKKGEGQEVGESLASGAMGILGYEWV